MTETRTLLPHLACTKTSSETAVWTSRGDWHADLLGELKPLLQKCIRSLHNVTLQWDVSEIGRIDTAGMLLHIQALEQLKKQGCTVEFRGQSQDFVRLYDLLQKYRTVEAASESPAQPSAIVSVLDDIGKRCVGL